MLLSQFNSFIVLLLIAASIISAILGDYLEAGAIMAIVILNAILGVVQEYRAEQALAALRRLAAPEAQVIRDGHRKLIPASQLVPGDLVLLEAGNYVPADLRLLQTPNLRVQEAALTGESEVVHKDAALDLGPDLQLGDRKNMAFMGTLISYGRGRGAVVSTGMQTQIGAIATMLQAVEEESTPLQQRLDNLGKLLGWATLGICALVFAIGALRGFNALDMFLIAVSLAVAAVPEGLPAVVTITLAIGMREMIQRNALIRRLSSVETLGSTTVICADKTGTLTQNRMTVTHMWVDGHGFEVAGQSSKRDETFRIDGKPVNLGDYPASTTALWIATLDNDAEFEQARSEADESYRVVGDPTDVALIVAAAKAGAHRDELERAYPRIGEIPFDSTRKRMTTVHIVRDPRPEDASPFYDHETKDWQVTATKGAPEVILDLCTQYQRINDTPAPLDEPTRQRIMQANDHMAQQALRVLAVAFRVEPAMSQKAPPEEVESKLIFVGLFGMIDPPRPEVYPAMEKARQAGIRTVMITGDYPSTARAIASSIGMLAPGHDVSTGKDLEAMDDEQLRQTVTTSDVFARVDPRHKMRIVEALKHNNHVVAMTGDGVNDAPALKRADIGVAMGIAGTDVARETADMVLTDDNYASIVAAVEQGRVIYANIRKFVFYLLSCNLAEIAVILLSILAGLPSPLNAIQLLWLNLVTDGAPALALGVEKGDPDIMQRKPRPPDEPIINKSMRLRIGIQTLAIATVTMTAYLLGLHLHPQTPTLATTMAFATISFSELLRAFTSRSENYPLHKIGLLGNKTMFAAVASSMVLLLAVIYVPIFQTAFNTQPLGWAQWRIILPLLILPSIVAELTKWAFSRHNKRHKT
jgi:Ca2+-transporting ATPase